MHLDTQLQLDSAHAYTAQAFSTNVWDTGPVTINTTRDLGAGEPLYLSILITTTVASNVSTVFTLESGTDTSMSSNVIHWTGNTVLLASLVAGYWYAQGILIPPGQSYKRYVGIRMTPSTSWSAGAASAWIHKGRFDTVVYGSGVTNSV